MHACESRMHGVWNGWERGAVAAGVAVRPGGGSMPSDRAAEGRRRCGVRCVALRYLYCSA